MSNKFTSILDKVGDGLKKFFTSPVAADVEDTGIAIAEVAFPALDPLLTGIKGAIAQAQALAQAANPAGETTAQVTALVLADAQQVFAAYEQATGTTIETSQQQAIINLFLQMLDTIPAPASTTSATTAATATTATATTTVAATAAAAPAVTAAPAAVVATAEAVPEPKPAAIPNSAVIRAA